MRLFNIILIALIIFVLFVFNPPQITSAKDFNPMKPDFKYITQIKGIKEYHLSNGLKVLLKENHTIPLVTFSVWYKVGARNEGDGIRGLAHFLEHMMFKGTKKFKKGEISETIQKLGGVFNAFTSQDGTAYYETISPKYLEKMLEIESDRMKGSLFAEEELNSERTVVLSELEGNLNNPATLIDQELHKTAYEISPYKHPTIGYQKDIKNINSNIMRDFYNKYYNPNNATIILAGDFNENNALNWISKYFGKIDNNNARINTLIPRDKEQKKEKQFTVKRTGSYKLLEIAYHIAEFSHKDIYPLNIIEEILIKGKKSKLNKALVETGLATEVSGGADATTDPGLFYILSSLTPKATHKGVEKIILSEIERLIKEPPSDEEITAAKNRIKASYLFNLDGTYNQVANLGFFELTNTWESALSWPDEISKVTREDTLRVLKKYFIKENRTIGYFIPIIRKGEKFEPQPINLSRTQHYIENETAKRRNGKTQNSTVKFQFKKIKLKDGSDLLIYNNIDLPITYISGVIKGGSSLLPKEKEWECQLIARTLEKGSKSYTKEQIEDFLDGSGSEITFSCEEESFKFNILSLNEKLNDTTNLLIDILNHPTFPKDEIEKEKEQIIAEIIESKDSTQETAKRKFSQLIYLMDHPYYLNDFDQDINYIKNIQDSALPQTHENLIKKNSLIISIVTSLNDNEINKIINDIENKLISQNKKITVIHIPDTLLRDNPKTEITHLKDKLQSDVFLGHAGNLKRTDPDFYKVHIANYILGGSSLASRLAKKVRDDGGLVYSIYSYINASHGKGEFGIYFGSNNANVDKAIELVKEELNSFVQKGITEEELKKAKASLIDSFVSRNLSSYGSIANTLAGIEFYNLGDNYINNYPNIINSLKLDEVNQAIKKYIFPDKLNISIAGEYKTKI